MLSISLILCFKSSTPEALANCIATKVLPQPCVGRGYWQRTQKDTPTKQDETQLNFETSNSMQVLVLKLNNCLWTILTYEFTL